MADLTSSVSRAIKAASGLAGEVADAVQTYAGMWAGLRGPDHATTQGYLDAYNDEKGMIWAGGHLDDQVLGDTSATPPTENRLGIDPAIYPQVAVTGVASRADIGKAVYATDSDVLTLTAPTYATPIGIVVEWHSSTTCDVLTFGLAAQSALDLSGQGTQVLHLGNFTFASMADGDILTSYPMPCHASIESFYAVVGTPLVGSGGTTALNLEIGTTNVTGGVLTASTAAGGTLGTVLTATAITAENVAHSSDSLSIEASSSGGTRTSGAFDLYVKIRPRMGV